MKKEKSRAETWPYPVVVDWMEEDLNARFVRKGQSLKELTDSGFLRVLKRYLKILIFSFTN